MYYITNQANQLIAIDNALLTLLQIKDIEELASKTILNELQFSLPEDEKISITHKDNTYQFYAQTHVLSSILGNFHLVHLQAIKDKKNLINTEYNPHSYENFDDLFFENNTQEEGDFLRISHEIDTQKEEIEDKLSSLTIPNKAGTTIEEITLENEEILKEEIFLQESSNLDHTPIFIDIENISKTIGISPNDYKTFLNEYIDNAISLEDSLKSDDKEKRIAAIEILTQLADVLQLPKVNDVISKINKLTSDKRPQMITTFYTLLSRLTVDTELQKIEKEESIKTFIKQEDIKGDEEKRSTDSFGHIDLHDVTPIYFNFYISQAANDLSLPEELIEEFVHDFIEQAHEETEKMLKAYEEGDLDTIQKIGHLLKGASSNLRIKELSDTLYAIQFCEDSSQIKDLIKEYWGHFLSFEQQIDMISTKRT